MASQVALDIFEQMGGIGLLTAMLGATNFVDNGNGAQFSFKGSRKFNKCVVTVDAFDTYTFQLWHISLRTGACNLRYELEMAYGDMLIDLFEEQTGLRIRLAPRPITRRIE